MHIRTLIAKYHELNPRGHFFDEAVTQHFSSRYHHTCFGDWIFVSSEVVDHTGKRRYTVRQMLLNGMMSTLSGFGAYSRLEEAVASARHYSKYGILSQLKGVLHV